MGYDIVKSIVFKNNKVYLTAADGRTYPRIFEEWESTRFSELYEEKGKEAALAAIAENIWDGNYKLYKSGNKYCRLFNRAVESLPASLNWSNFDSKTAGAYLAKAVVKLEKDPKADLTEDANNLLALINDREHIYEASVRTGHNFLNFAGEEIRNDREFALKLLKEAGDRAWFDYPIGFEADKEFALEAVKRNGCFYRSLDKSLRADRDIILEAFKESEHKRYHEHLPDLIPSMALFEFETDPFKPTLDKEFVLSLIDICPAIHIDRAKWLLEDRDIALKVCEKGKWIVFNADGIPDKYLKEKEFQDILLGRCKDENALQKLKTTFSVKGIALLGESLEDRIMKASEKQKSISDRENNISEKETER